MNNLHEIFTNYLLEEAEDNVRYFLKRQIPDGPRAGAIPDPDILWPPFPRNASIRLLEMVSVWLSPASSFYQNPEIPRRGLLTLAWLAREQRPSGNIDLYTCNFDSAPDSGFFLWDLIPLMNLLEGAEKNTNLSKETREAAGDLLKEDRALILRVLEGLRSGGFHTANHRWVNSSNLAAGYKLTGNQAYLDRANQYLAEGIDCNEDGEYSERSAIYNAVNNQGMITLFESLGDKKYLSYVQRNLSMLSNYFEADGSLFTENSTRQDRGTKMYAGHYLYQYLYIGHYLKDTEAMRMASWIAKWYLKEKVKPAPDCLYSLILHPELKLEDAKNNLTLPDYHRYFKTSGVVRYKKDSFTYSLLKDNSKWLCFSSGSLNCYSKMSLGYFSHGPVKIQELEVLPDGYRFAYHADGYYFEPLDKPTGDLINFRTEDHSLRRKQVPNSSEMIVTVHHRDKRIELNFEGSGCTGVHYCFEFVLPPGIPVAGDHFAVLPKPGDYLLIKDGSAVIRNGMDALKISGAFADDNIFATSRNADPRSLDSFTLYMNATAPYNKTMTIEAV